MRIRIFAAVLFLALEQLLFGAQPTVVTLE